MIRTQVRLSGQGVPGTGRQVITGTQFPGAGCTVDSPWGPPCLCLGICHFQECPHPLLFPKLAEALSAVRCKQKRVAQLVTLQEV